METKPIPIIRSSRRKTLAIQFGRDGKISIRAPEKLPESIIERFVKEQAVWIEKHLRTQRKCQPPKKTFCEGESFLFLGNHIRLEIVERGTESLWLDETFKLVSRNQFRAKTLFETWYKKEARRAIHDRVKHYADIMETKHGTIRLSGAHHTWGSCTPDNRLNFTWRLIMTPPEVMDYVVVHELAHVLHKNHGKRFWQHVARFCPEHKKHRAWLGTHGHLLEI